MCTNIRVIVAPITPNSSHFDTLIVLMSRWLNENEEKGNPLEPIIVHAILLPSEAIVQRGGNEEIGI